MASSQSTRYCVFEEDGGSSNLGQHNINDKDTRTKATHVELLNCGIIATVSCVAYGTWDGRKAAMLVLQFRLRAPEGVFRFRRAELSLKFESQEAQEPDHAHPVIRKVHPKNNRMATLPLQSQASSHSTSSSSQVPSSGIQTPNSSGLWPATSYSISKVEWLGKSKDEPDQAGWRIIEPPGSGIGICDAIPLCVIVTFSGPFKAEIRANATILAKIKVKAWPWSRDDPLLFDGATPKGWQLASTDFLDMGDEDLETFMAGEGRSGLLSFDRLSPSKPIEAQAQPAGEQLTKVYRAQGISTNFACEDFIQAVSTILTLSKDTINVKSFSRKENTAIVSFSSAPPAMHSYAFDKSWQIQIPAIDTSDSKLHTTISKIKFDRDFLGFTSLGYSKDSLKANVDIIAIHGLGGHAYGSFKQRGSNFMWLSDALQYDIAQVRTSNSAIRPRVLIYGYNSRINDSNSFQSIKDLSIELRRLLREIRRDDPTRPIIFIGHSLGGLLIKELLIQQSQSTNKDIDVSSFESCIGVLFFGVPNRGMDISALLAIIGSQPNSDFLASLSIGSPFLEDQATLFPETFCSRDAVVYSFYETCLSNTAKMVNGQLTMTGDPVVLVEENSATHSRPWEMEGTDYRIPIRRSHADLVKFEQYSTDYVMVKGCIRDILIRHFNA